MKKHLARFSGYCSLLWLSLSVCACNPSRPTAMMATGARAQRASVAPHETLVVDRRVREMARHIKPSSVRILRFYGVQMLQHFANDPIKVTDADKIDRFIQALRQASTRHQELANRVNTLEISFRPHKGHTRETITLYFNAASPADCFGPKFYAALRTIITPQPGRISPFPEKK